MYISPLSFILGAVFGLMLCFVVAVLLAIRKGMADAYEGQRRRDWLADFRRAEATRNETVEAYRRMVNRRRPNCEIVKLRRGKGPDA